MKRRYEFPIQIVEGDFEDSFAFDLENKIKNLQNRGFYVEVQYSAHEIDLPDSCTRYTALLLPYKEE